MLTVGPIQVARNGQLLVFFGDLATPTGFDIFTLPLSGGTPTAVIQGGLTDAE
jgi:hypothetical protein